MEKILHRTVWSPRSYTNFKQYIKYFCHLNPVFQKLSTLPPIVSINKIQRSKSLITGCEDGKNAFLHIGDCAEPFEHATESILQHKIQFLNECQNTLAASHKKPTHIIGRIAGQYAKPRSSEFVQINGVKIHNYKGDNINGLSEDDRNPCENKLMTGYHHSSNSAALIESRFPDLFISHEGLVLPYEASLTREHNGKYYCQSAHMIWIGERTRQLDGAHVEFFRGLENPIGVKVSSNIDEKQFLKLVTTLNPKNQKGKLLVIVRMGKEKIKQKFKALANIKNNQGLNFLFVTDPMHGNTFDSKPSKLKTRSLHHILQEIKHFQEVLKDKKMSYGYSLEATFENVTECHGLQFPMHESQISKQLYKSKCDPRLNKQQTLKLLQLLSI